MTRVLGRMVSDQTYASCMVVAAFSRNCNNGEIITKKSREKVGKIATFYYGLENVMSGKLSRESDGRECCSREKDVAPRDGYSSWKRQKFPFYTAGSIFIQSLNAQRRKKTFG